MFRLWQCVINCYVVIDILPAEHFQDVVSCLCIHNTFTIKKLKLFSCHMYNCNDHELKTTSLTNQSEIQWEMFPCDNLNNGEMYQQLSTPFYTSSAE